jgi:NAD+ synthase (glutamine-hydrolysing)
MNIKNIDVSKISDLILLTKDLRNFKSEIVLKAKLEAINNFFKTHNLDSCVLGLSGGIDSSVVLMLLLEASKLSESPIKKVIGAFMPIYSQGITGQDAANVYVNQLLLFLAESYSVFNYRKIDLSIVSNEYSKTLNIRDKRTVGQIDSIIRTPAMYGLAADLQYRNFKSIVVGTTNRDEGAYIGFYGKASDGMNDLQPIADLHKSEVIELAKLLNIDKHIINRPPMGDVWDGSLDEDTIGAPYWALEMYQILMEFNATYLINRVTNCPELIKYVLNIESIHNINAHKYMVGSPSHYIDVMNRKIK